MGPGRYSVPATSATALAAICAGDAKVRRGGISSRMHACALDMLLTSTAPASTVTPVGSPVFTLKATSVSMGNAPSTGHAVADVEAAPGPGDQAQLLPSSSRDLLLPDAESQSAVPLPPPPPPVLEAAPEPVAEVAAAALAEPVELGGLYFGQHYLLSPGPGGPHSRFELSLSSDGVFGMGPLVRPRLPPLRPTPVVASPFMVLPESLRLVPVESASASPLEYDVEVLCICQVATRVRFLLAARQGEMSSRFASSVHHS